ncbi:hypothetical protein [Tsukamurella paurometabola]|uniref:Uncharacterized protein n=1 Tax=Tsukamurella paurometabola TaxID=2061 RepID=A0ABS5NI98_TSUPA|nr:hypothetical protein [Tsukamurella paurometabola]MBS4104021.1 hypothetical protein [Tsukamurella paurometabola]
MSNDTAFTLLDEPQKFRTIHDVENALDDLLPDTSFTPPQLARIAAVAREKHADRRTQLVAILDAAAQEAAAHPPAEASPALRALDRCRAEFALHMSSEAGAVCVELERDRPNWSAPECDQPCSILPNASRWRSKSVELPLTMHYGHRSDSGGVERAYLQAHLSATPIDREPFVRVSYHGWREDGTPSLGRLNTDLRLGEAEAFARTLLLLIDAAREEVGGE